MIKISIYKDSTFAVDEKLVKGVIADTLKKHKVFFGEVSVAIVGEKKMAELVDKYYKKDKGEHPVLTFPDSEIGRQFVFPPDGVLHLGEIIIAYTPEQKVLCDFAKHATLHLLGIHHH